MYKIIALTVWVWSAVLHCAQGQENKEFVAVTDKTAIEAKIKEKSSKLESIEADFTESKHLSFMKEPQVSHGKFYYQKEDNMKWEQVTPYSYILLVNGDDVSVFEKGKKKNIMAQRQIFKIKDLMMGLVNGSFSESKFFETSYYEGKSAYLVNLRPDSGKLRKFISKIELYFSKESFVLQKMVMTETSGDKSITAFSNQKLNQQIDINIFKAL